MKSLLLPFLLSLFSLVLNAQNHWLRTYDFNNGNTDLCFKIIETSQSNYVLCGATTIPSLFSYGFDGIVLSLNQNGDTIWSKKLGSMEFGAQNDFLFDVIENSNNELILTGVRKQGTQKQQLWMVKILLNTNGTQITNITEKQFGLSDKDDGGAKIIQNPDGTYFVVGYTESYGTQQGGKDAWLVKLNANLDTLWTKTYDLGYEEGGEDIKPFQNGYLMIVNSTTGLINFPVPYYTSFSNILYIEQNGNILKQLTFNTDTINFFSKIKLTNDGGAILIGSTSMYDNNLGGRDIFLVKLNSSADVEWTKVYGGFGKYDGGNDILQATDGSYYLAAYSQTQFTSSVDNWWLMRLNSNGDTLYTKWLITYPNNDDPASMLFASDGSLVVAGWVGANSNPANGWNMGNANICVAKLDTLFNYTSLPTLTEPCTTFHIYPNPAQTYTYIYIHPNITNASIIITDLIGREVIRLHAIMETPCKLNISELNKGLYFIHLVKNDRIIETQKIVVD